MCVFVLLWYQIVVVSQNELRNHSKRHLIFFITSVLIPKSISLLGDLIRFFGGAAGQTLYGRAEASLVVAGGVGGVTSPGGWGLSICPKRLISTQGSESPLYPRSSYTIWPHYAASHPPKAAPSGQQRTHCETGHPGCTVISCKSQDKTVLFFSPSQPWGYRDKCLKYHIRSHLPPCFL